MSAVQGQSPRASADTTEHAADGSGQEPHASSPGTDFGPNEWLVDELYQRYLADPGSVDRAWWNFFADYHPKPVDQPRTAAAPAQAPPAGAPAPAPPAAPGGGARGRAAGAPPPPRGDHGREPVRAHRDQRAGHPGQAPGRQ